MNWFKDAIERKLRESRFDRASWNTAHWSPERPSAWLFALAVFVTIVLPIVLVLAFAPDAEARSKMVPLDHVVQVQKWLCEQRRPFEIEGRIYICQPVKKT